MDENICTDDKVSDSVCIKQIGKGSFSNVYLFENKEYTKDSLNLESLLNFRSFRIKEPFFIIKEVDLTKLVYKYLYKGNPVANKIKYRPRFNDRVINKKENVGKIDFDIGNGNGIENENRNGIENEAENGIKIKKRGLEQTTSVNITPWDKQFEKRFTQTIKVNYTEEEYYYYRLQELIESEILILKNLSHKNIIKFFSSTVSNDVYSIKMEYCELGDLYSILKEKGKHIYDLKKLRNEFNGFNDSFIKRYLQETISALKYISDCGLIHRDIKLHNILVKMENGEYVFKLSDFGFACYDLGDHEIGDNINKIDKLDMSSFLNITPESLKRKYYKLCGTPYYMAPEIILNLEKFEQLMERNVSNVSNVSNEAVEHKNENTKPKLYNKNVDIWSYGICLYELIFNTLPFTNLSDMNDLKLFYKKNDNQYLIYKNIDDKKILTEYSKKILKGMLTINPKKRISINELSELDFTKLFIIEQSCIKSIKNPIQYEINMESWILEDREDRCNTESRQGETRHQDSWYSIKKSKNSSSLIMDLSIDNNFKSWLKKPF